MTRVRPNIGLFKAGAELFKTDVRLTRAKAKLSKELIDDYNKIQLLIPATELTNLGLTCTKYCISCLDMIYKGRN